MIHSLNCVSFIASFEGCKLQSYRDQRGIWTIGFGNTGPTVSSGQTITLLQAKQLLDTDLDYIDKYLNSVIKVTTTQNQFDALVSLAFNIGIGNFHQSTVLRDLNDGNYSGAANGFLMWDEVNHVVDSGLLRRREAERTLFLQT